ncbi:hypothetical protein [Desulfolucanica intricata]|uniref:hypothetical protein n=1 Tax=Desulfolucanica intricata TaxID=1285191 RepID=UPI00082D1F3A|nr:hypothetical protein [Desulfolucanica intricata]
MISVFKAANASQPQLRELDPVTIQRIKEGAFLVKFISESQVASRKCEYYAENASDEEIKRSFMDEAKNLKKLSHTFQQYYESMTKE